MNNYIYDCTEDVLKHRAKVAYWLRDFAHSLERRAEIHDQSKLQDNEKSIFDVYTPKLRELKFGSDEYKQALSEMGAALKHHYSVNRHHPEHFENGIDGMTLYDLIEMFCDWLGATEERKKPLDIDTLKDRFNLSPQLVNILLNTTRYIDYWCEVNDVPVTYFTPENHQGEYQP